MIALILVSHFEETVFEYMDEEIETAKADGIAAMRAGVLVFSGPLIRITGAFIENGNGEELWRYEVLQKSATLAKTASAISATGVPAVEVFTSKPETLPPMPSDPNFWTTFADSLKTISSGALSPSPLRIVSKEKSVKVQKKRPKTSRS